MYGFDTYAGASYSSLSGPVMPGSTEIAQQGYPQVFDSNGSGGSGSSNSVGYVINNPGLVSMGHMIDAPGESELG